MGARGAQGGEPRPGAAVRVGAVVDLRAVAHLIPAARAARDALTASGHSLSRDRLADRMREEGHGVSNASAGLLVRILKAEAHVTPIEQVPTSAVDPETGDGPHVAA